VGIGYGNPYIIKKHFNEINENDILIYLDAGCSINSKGITRLNEYIEMLNQNNESSCISFQMSYPEKNYTIKEIFQYFNVEQNCEIVDSGQLIGGIQIIRKNSNSIKLVNLWNQTLYDNPLLFTDYYNKNQNGYFIDNRHDQSIFSVIKKMYNPIILDDESIYNPFDKKTYLKYPFVAQRRFTKLKLPSRIFFRIILLYMTVCIIKLFLYISCFLSIRQ
jgi:hypothetical protein